MDKRFFIVLGAVGLIGGGIFFWDAYRKEAKCAGYEKEMSSLVRDGVENMVATTRLLQATDGKPMLGMAVLGDLTALQAKQDRLQGEADSIRAKHKEECGVERNDRWWNENMEKAKREVDPSGEIF